jgi:ATP-dependent DNA helicase RecQ/Werner syndrome ATP-dependent helicase
MNNTIDEFGGDFLADFDVDAAVRARNTTPNETNNNNNKRQKTDRDPFSENSPFTRGYTTNPIHELSSTIPPSQQQQQPPHVPVVTQKALEETLQQYFGHSHFRPGQVQVLEAILQKRDAAVFWATGSGKSICYQIPPLFVPNGVALVVSPLISLMQDQVNKLNGLFPQPLATFLGSAQTDASEETAALHGAYRLVYVTPEKLLSRGFLHRVARSSMAHSLVCVAVDESHCVSEWGHDFRADYRRLHHIRRAIPTVPIVALTATAVPRVQEDIVTLLRLHDPLVARRSFDRPNLVISVQKKRGLHAAMEPLLSNMATQSTIVYAPTRDGVEEIAAWLAANLPQRAGDDADADAARVRPYHAGLSSQERTRAHFDFLTGTCKVIVATVAFGMGVRTKPCHAIIIIIMMHCCLCHDLLLRRRLLALFLLFVYNRLTSPIHDAWYTTVLPRRWKSTTSKLDAPDETDCLPNVSCLFPTETLTSTSLTFM